MEYHIKYRGDIIASFEFECDRDICYDALGSKHSNCPGFEKYNEEE